MTRYIDAEKVIEAIYDLPNCPNGYSDTYDKECIIGTIEEVPTADVVPKEKIIEFITNKLTQEISERLIQALEANYEIIPKKPVLRTRYIDAETLQKKVEFIKNAPTADIVGVARCKDCKHYLGLAECALIGGCMGTDGCLWGERREDVSNC